jgi:uncharacterized protein (TIGR02996 family)
VDEELALLRFLAARPDDFNARAAYADWLRDHARETEADAVAGTRFERRTVFEPAYDHRNQPGGGTHGVQLRMVLIGPVGAVQFLAYLPWNLPAAQDALDRQTVAAIAAGGGDALTILRILYRPMAADLGYHARVPQYDGQAAIKDGCEYLGGPCYYDGSGLNAEVVLNVLITKGSEGVWDYLDKYYHATFTGGEYPRSADYGVKSRWES